MHRCAKLRASEIILNILIGLAVSVVMLNLGAALGILSGRGAFAGMLSAGLIALVTSAFGGTRIQGSGATAPMSTVTAVVVAYAAESLPASVAGVDANHFVNIVLLLTAVLLVVAGLLRLGRFISCVPNLVISGFMCGIAMIIWTLQFKLLLGVGREPIGGPVLVNLAIAAATLGLAFVVPPLLKSVSVRLAAMLPGTLVAVIVVSVLAGGLDLPVAFLALETRIGSFDDFAVYIRQQIPDRISAEVVLLALPFALKLAALCYVDTLLTSLIVDKMRGTRSRQNRELMAQGAAAGIVALAGGVPGAQSTVPSVLLVKEGATLRLAGICAGLFVLVEMMLFADWMAYIPQAAFAGILIKVGYDVFDIKPLWAYARTLRRTARRLPTRVLGHKEMTILSGTALVTAFVDLIAAVGLFTVGFHLANRLLLRGRQSIRDYVPA